MTSVVEDDERDDELEACPADAEWVDESDAAGEKSPDGRAAYAVDRATEPNLRIWIGQVVEREEDALSRLYDAMAGRIYGLALRITRNVQTAEEVVEDTFWQVWRQAPRFDPERGSAAGWMLNMTRSRASMPCAVPTRCNAMPKPASTSRIWPKARKICLPPTKPASNWNRRWRAWSHCRASLSPWHFSVA